MGWEPLETVVIGILMLRIEPKLAIKKQGLSKKDFFWSAYPPAKTGISAKS